MVFVPGMWSASFYIGNFIGPTVAGFLVDAYGFQWTTIVFFGLYGFILIVDICELSYNIIKSRTHVQYENIEGVTQSNEKLPLLDSNKFTWKSKTVILNPSLNYCKFVRYEALKYNHCVKDNLKKFFIYPSIFPVSYSATHSKTSF